MWHEITFVGEQHQRGFALGLRFELGLLGLDDAQAFGGLGLFAKSVGEQFGARLQIGHVVVGVGAQIQSWSKVFHRVLLGFGAATHNDEIRLLRA